jgi:predicted dehydrogenase
VYDKGVTVNNNPEGVYQLLVGYRTGDMWAPQIDTTEALRVEAQHFVECIEAHKQPMSDGLVGLRTVQILQAASESLRRRGQPVDLVW